MEGTSRMGLIEDKYQPENPLFTMRDIDDGFDDNSRSGSDNFDVADDQDAAPNAANKKKSCKRKKYHRHTPSQIQDLENFFQNCPHPDEKQRLELGKRLGLESRQVKFWFQNRRTQLKTKLERHENVLLKQEYEKLRMENMAIKEYVGKPLCKGCGGAALIDEISVDEHQLRLENTRLKEELIRVCGITEKFMGKSMSDIVSSFSQPQMVNSHVDLSVGRNRGLTFGGGSNAIGGNGFATASSSSSGLLCNDYEKSMYVQVAVAAMEELIVLSQNDSPFWIRSLDGGKETLNHEKYVKKFNPCGANPPAFTSEATRATGSVIVTSLELVNTLMNPRRWVEMFPCMIGKASTIDVLSNGIGGTHDGELLMIDAELLFPSPLVPLRHIRFIRYCKQHSEGAWAVVDVSIDPIRDGYADVTRRCRKLPSGCIVQDLTDGYSLVTCVDHADYDECGVHSLFRPLVQSGFGFGAWRWLATLQRQCECLAFLATSEITPRETSLGITPEGRKSVLKLTRRVIDNFCAGICASSIPKWDKIDLGEMAPNLQVMTRVSINEPGELSGIILSFATSVWMPVSRQQLFDFLRNEQLRGHWDILANDGPMQEMIRITKSTDTANSISILCPPAAVNREPNMVVVQETWGDKASSAVVYAPVDVATITSVMEGGDSDLVKLLPSGFVITDGSLIMKAELSTNIHAAPSSLLTLGFQILMDSVPTAKLTVESIDTVNGLMNRTIQKIKAALHCE